jgi:hypothetical protein
MDILSSILKVAEPLYRPVFVCAKRLLHKAEVWLFRVRHRKPPLSPTEAVEVATSILGGYVIDAIPFYSLDSNKIRIAAARATSEDGYDTKIYVLEQLGGTFRTSWISARLWSRLKHELEVDDIDGDGNPELIYEDHSHGTGGGSSSVYVYFPQGNRLASLTESLNWQNLSGAVAPEISINPDNDPSFFEQISKTAVRRGFLNKPPLVDFDNTDYAAQRWHKENGKFPHARLKLHYYGGLPQFRSSVAATLKFPDRIWVSFFKGVLVEYDPIRDRHCVVYSPAWFYNWVKCMAFDGTHLWCGLHCTKGLISYDPLGQVLLRHEKFRGVDLPEVCSLKLNGGILVLNDSVEILASSLISSPSVVL